MTPILEVHHVSKQYRIRHSASYLSLRERMLSLLRFERTQSEDFMALHDISFDVKQGESIGIIGRNGAGKSTLLKILSKITPPTAGRITIRGRIASLLEVGTGFHPELTGRENIFFNGSLLGMKRREIEARFDEIVDFSGVEKFLDTPLKHYSSGMQLRLAFSVAAFLEPEIMVIDEVLAVGDAEFQKKCLGKMEDVTRGGRTILFVSHNMSAVMNLCRQGLLLNQGKVQSFGPIAEVIKDYQGHADQNTDRRWIRHNPPPVGRPYIAAVEIALVEEQPHRQLLKLQAQVISNGIHDKAFIAVDFINSLGNNFMQALPKGEPFVELQNETLEIEVVVELPPLIPDIYYVSVWIGSHYTHTYDFVEEVVKFEIEKSPTEGRTFPHAIDHGVIVPRSTYNRIG